MNLFWIAHGALQRRPLEELPALAQRDDGYLWIDVPACDDQAAQLLRQHLGFHPHGIDEARRRAPIPKIHVYQDHFFCVLHTPELAPQGKLHVFQTALFIHEHRYLVSLHLPAEAGCAPELVWRETDQVRERIEQGRLQPKTPGQLGHAIVSAMGKRLDSCVSELAHQVSRIESSVTRGRLSEYERLLEGLFQVRHNLQAARTIAGTSREVHARMLAFSRGLKDESALWLQDLVDHFDRLKNVCDEEKELLQEVLDLYQTRVANDLSQLVRKLTALGAILVADTLVAGIYG
ncbi:MAG TPA: CorA family divalent cation transporter, partial [Nevskiaceae bacterium]|nr:CorA family divalent cation transporter [Nevskiaceae bacterium]